uniref:F-box domain-containing protein n=1 Tax=Acrobeloides nanus TaxID=290746 RepID=A0A914E9Z2_9BILA
MKELDQHCNLFFSIPALNDVQIDIFRDILKFLDGPSIENCSLVSRSWENFIRIYRKIMPLRKIYALVIHQEYDTDNLVVRIFHKTYPRNIKRKSYFYYSTDAAEELVKIHNFYKTPEKKMKMNKKSSIHIPEDNHVKISALKNCIFDQIVLDFSKFSQIWQVNYSVDLFGKLVEICGQKIKTIRLDDGKSDNLIAYASSLYPKIFNYVDADRLDKNMLKEVNSIVSNPNCLFTIPNPPTHIELSCEEHVDYIFFNHPFEIMEINRFGGLIDLIKIFDCLIQSQSDVSRYSLQFTPRYTSDDTDIDISHFHLDQSLFHQDLDTFCEKVLLAFESTSEPGNLPPQIKINISDGGNYDQFLQRLFDRSGNLDKKRIKHKNAKGVKFQRSDQIIGRRSAAWLSFKNLQDVLKEVQDPKTRAHLFNSTVLPALNYGSETLTLRNSDAKKLQTTQRAMERKVLGVRLIDKVKSDEIRTQTMFKDAAQDARKRKLRWAGHIARRQDNTGPREQPSGGPTISSDLLDDHHTDGDEKWNKPLVQTGTTLPEIEKNTEGG